MQCETKRCELSFWADLTEENLKTQKKKKNPCYLPLLK